MRKTIVCGVTSGGIVIANYDTIEEYLDPLGMRHMKSLYKHCIPVGLATQVIVDIAYADPDNDAIGRLQMNSDGEFTTRIVEGGHHIVARLSVGESGLVFIGDPAQFCVEKGSHVPFFPFAGASLASDLVSDYIQAYCYPLGCDRFYQLDVTISEGED